MVVVDDVDAVAKEALWTSFENCEVRSVEMWVDNAHPGKYFIRPLAAEMDGEGGGGGGGDGAAGARSGSKL